MKSDEVKKRKFNEIKKLTIKGIQRPCSSEEKFQIKRFMDRKRLFSIGKLSRLTGVHIQSLRYYEELGILKPAYIDPESRYRYYTFPQTRIVEAIQYCVDLDIPLKGFKAFLSEKDGKIDYHELLEYGKKTAEDKMRRIGERLDFLNNMQQEMEHAKTCGRGVLTRAVLPERTCWTMPYTGTQTGSMFHSAIYRLISEVEKKGLHAGFNNGQLVRYTDKGIFSYLFIDLREKENLPEDDPRLIRIPGGEYTCTVSDESCIMKAPEIFPELFKKPSGQIAVEVELFSEQFSYSEPVFELRCGAYA